MWYGQYCVIFDCDIAEVYSKNIFPHNDASENEIQMTSENIKHIV